MDIDYGPLAGITGGLEADVKGGTAFWLSVRCTRDNGYMHELLRLRE